MSKTKELLLLHLVQAAQSLERAKNNAYSDSRMENYHDQLSNLYSAVQKEVASLPPAITDTDIYDGPKKHLDFIFKSLEFLDSSTLNQIPYEIVACLNDAMKESLKLTDKYIIVTSLINDVNGFSYDPMIAFDDPLYQDIETKYGIKFDDRLVQINLPRAFSRDYLAAVALYHELGHFIDMRFYIMESLVRTLFGKLVLNIVPANQRTDLQTYFPLCAKYIAAPHPRPPVPRHSNLFETTLSHFMEYFCDLFATQYTGEAFGHYLTYLTRNIGLPSTSHPSTVNRMKVVSDYLSNTPNIVITLINEALQGIRSTTLQKRYADVSSADFHNLVPTELKSEKELHGLINIAWEIWINERDRLGKQLNSTDTLKIYNVINNLVEKSIGNFITVNKWQKAYTQLHPPAAPPAVPPTPPPAPTPVPPTPAPTTP